MRSEVERWRSLLQKRLGESAVQTSVPLAPLTTFRIGGAAELLVTPSTADELAAAVECAMEYRIPFFLLGRGANILVGDGGIRGLVIKNEASRISFLERGRVRAESGAQVYPDLIDATVARGLGGLHHFAGIPSTVGGAVWQNLHFLAPAPRRERTVFLEEVFLEAEIFSQEGERRAVDRDYLRFGYDYSILHDRTDVVLSATFALEDAPTSDLRRVIEENLLWRAERHPDLERLPSAGSVFRKVEGIGAGRLIEECGLKGHTIGRAQVYPGHANIIVNLGGATAADVRALIELIQETVWRETGYRLEPEITLVGEFL